MVDPDDPATSYDGLHLVTDFTYADDGTMASKIVDPDDPIAGYDGLNLTSNYTYTDSGKLETETDPRGNTTTFTYDLAGRMVAQTNPTDATWTYSFDILGELTTSTDPEGAMTSWIYLGMIGQPDSKFDADNNVWNYERDARARITRELGPLGHDILYDYDANGRVGRQVVDPEDPATPGAELHLVTTYAYDNAGRLTAGGRRSH